MHIAAMICFESTIPSLNAEFVRKGAEVLVYVVNDGWYTTPPEPWQHASRSIFRAIESDSFVLRSANKGLSAIINNKGQIIKSLNEIFIMRIINGSYFFMFSFSCRS